MSSNNATVSITFSDFLYSVIVASIINYIFDISIKSVASAFIFIVCSILVCGIGEFFKNKKVSQ